MKSEEANGIALTSVRNTFAAAHGFEVSIRDTPVTVTIGAPVATDWPREIAGLSEEADGRWPSSIPFRCTWEGGAVDLFFYARADARELAKVSLAIGFGKGRWLGHCNVAALLASSEQPEVRVPNRFAIKKRDGGEAQRKANRKLREVFAASGLPMLSKASVEVFRVRTEDSVVLPSASEAFERFIRICLIKLDFISRRGTA